MLSRPNSPLLVLLQVVDPSVLAIDDLTDLADPLDYSTHENRLILAKQLVEHGANVNAVTIPNGTTPLHNACSYTNVTNLDFVQLLLEKGANPNAQDHLGKTPLMHTTPEALGAAKFLLNWLTTDVNITTRSGASFLADVRTTVIYLSDQIENPDNPDRPNQIQHHFLIRQWFEIEAMLMERGAVDTNIVE